MLRSVLTIDTMNVIRIDKINGITTLANLAGSLGKPKTVSAFEGEVDIGMLMACCRGAQFARSADAARSSGLTTGGEAQSR